MFNHFRQDGFVIQKRGNFFRKIHIQYRNIPLEIKIKLFDAYVGKIQKCENKNILYNYLKKKITG